MEQKEQQQCQLNDVINYLDYFLFTMCHFVILVEKSVFSIWVDLFLCRSIQLFVLSYA